MSHRGVRLSPPQRPRLDPARTSQLDASLSSACAIRPRAARWPKREGTHAHRPTHAPRLEAVSKRRPHARPHPLAAAHPAQPPAGVSLSVGERAEHGRAHRDPVVGVPVGGDVDGDDEVGGGAPLVVESNIQQIRRGVSVYPARQQTREPHTLPPYSPQETVAARSSLAHKPVAVSNGILSLRRCTSTKRSTFPFFCSSGSQLSAC